MEEVWKDINLSSLHDNPSDFRGMILQDFLARPPCTDNNNLDLVHGNAVNTVTPPTTSLSLNWRPEKFHFHFLSPPPPPTVTMGNVSPGSNCGVLAATSSECRHEKRRFSGQTEGVANGGDDRRHKRMIKNRESAARSRARKQAYTNELEREVADLLEENTRLKKQQQQQQLYMTAAEVPTKQTLRRTSTAPF